ncbi:MAG: O-antigen ligase family protein [Saprospiraceae bacterium]|nr:O-antigen ligase family protein [Saprospiraceae bacterium]
MSSLAATLQVPRKPLLWGFGILVVLSLFLAITTEYYFLAGIPLAALIGFVTITDFKLVFYLLLACLPLSMEVNLPGGFGTDLPSEPLMLLLMGVTIFYVLAEWQNIKSRFLLHPVTLLLLLHIGWIVLTTITSKDLVISIKFVLAKIWYVTTFYFLASIIFKKPKRIKRMVWAVTIPMVFTILVILFKHAGYGFSFVSINKAVSPFYRNHVSYACLVALMFPMVWMATGWYKRWSWKWMFLVLVVLISLVGIYFSYTRAAYVTIFMALGGYFIIKWRLVRYTLLAAIIAVSALVGYLAYNNNYLDYAPNYNKTITHKNFDNLLEATYKGEDISTMERVYRWVAAFYMSKEARLTGYGPGNFVNFYKPYAVTSFITYVSDNPERSGVHCYYLMTLVEQGLPGFLIFILLLFAVFIKGENVYHSTSNKERQNLVMMALLSLITMSGLLLINDMVETDKLGPFFFMTFAIIVNQDIQNKNQASKTEDL